MTLRSIRFRSRGLLPSTLAAVACGGLLALTSVSFAVGTRHFVLESGSDFEKGDFEGVAVDSTGVLRSGLDLGKVEVAAADTLWATHQTKDGLLLGTGNEAKLLRLQAGKADVVATVKGAIAITSIVDAFGKTLVSALPGGKLYELDGNALKEFTELKGAAHVWAMSYDDSSKALFAATGPDGKLFRITADGTAQVYYDAPQKHLVTLLATQGKVYAGSSGEARLFEVTGPGRARVMFDFSATEVRGIALSKDGSVFAIANELAGGPRSDSISKLKPQAPDKASPPKGKGKLYRFHPDGAPEELYFNKEEHFVSLTLDAAGRPVVGTGLEGKVIVVDENHNHSVIADVDERQVTQVTGTEKGGWVLGSDPVMAHPIHGVGGKEATWTSEVLDAGLRAKFGRLTWEARGKVELATRSGNTEEPDETWTDWSAPLTVFGEVKSPPGRYLQVRVRMVAGNDSSVRRIDVPFVTDNLRPVLTQVEAKSLAQTKGSSGLEESGGPIEGKGSSKIKLSWKVDNPDEDELRYRVEYRLEEEKGWFDALPQEEVLTSANWDWETEDLPEGRYRVRITASDELANTPARAQTHQLESESILVDNTPPSLKGVRLVGRKVVGTAVDRIGPVRRIEVRLAGQKDWIMVEPKDGIFDESQEEFEVDLSKVVTASGGLVTVRVFDTAGNFEVDHVRVPAET